MFVVETLEDFIAYFRRTYIAKPEGDRLVPFFVEDRVGGDGVALCHFNKDNFPEGRIVVTFQEILNTFKLLHPSTGAVSTKDSLIYVSIHPMRQYKKGVSEDRLSIHRYHSRAIAPEDWNFHRWVNHIYNNRFFKVDELVKALSNGDRIGGALSPKLGIIIRQNISQPLLVYKKSIIGALDNSNRILLFPAYSIYKDYISRTTKKEIRKWNS